MRSWKHDKLVYCITKNIFDEIEEKRCILGTDDISISTTYVDTMETSSEKLLETLSNQLPQGMFIKKILYD
jgi:hypothetical protein